MVFPLSTALGQLPVAAIYPELLAALGANQPVVLQAPPGAGKSTALPLALLQSGLIEGRIIMLEPRRLAARNIARFIASQLGEEVGEQVGYRVRGESKVGKNTRLEIVTEGILTRLIQNDPELGDVGLVIFDEFHERSLHADLALALCIESRMALREDLGLLVMSATLDGIDFSTLLPGHCLLQSAGRSYPIEHHYRPANRQQPLVPQLGAVVLEALAKEQGSMLIFLPGVGEIERLAQWLYERLGERLADPALLITPLHGRLPFAEQQRAIAPAPDGQRKLVLATNVAETSLTIEGISVVVDSGLERRVRFDASAAAERLELKSISKSSATQRAGRAGRLGPGVCYRLWSSEQQERLEEQTPPEIRVAELTNFLLECLLWGSEPGALPLLEQPPAANLSAAYRLLSALGAFDGHENLSQRGRQLALLPCHPRLAHLLLTAAELEGEGLSGIAADGCQLVALLDEEKRGADRLSGLLAQHSGAIRESARRWWRRLLPLAELPVQMQGNGQWLGLLCALAWPDRIGRLRSGSRYQLSGGQSADLPDGHSLTGSQWLVATQLTHAQSSGQGGLRIYTAEPLDLALLERYQPQLFTRQSWFGWDEREERVRAESQKALGAIVLERQPMANLDDEQKARCLLEGIRSKGLGCLPWEEESEQYLARLRCGCEWLPELNWPQEQFWQDDSALLASLESWLLPHLGGMSRLEQLKRLDLSTILRQSLPWPLPKELEEALPTHFTAPTGSRLRIRYQAGEPPVLPVRIQEMFGQAVTPSVAHGRVALLVELLSPAQRPLQLTRDLVAFWQGSYSDVKKEMKGRYPKHYWPDNPLEAMPTRYTKNRMNQDHGSA